MRELHYRCQSGGRWRADPKGSVLARITCRNVSASRPIIALRRGDMQHSDNRARLYRTRLIAAISILAGSLHLPATAGPTADQDLSLCTDKVANHTIRIANCSMVLTAGDLSDNARGAALYNRGQAYLAQGQAEKALDDFNAALEIAPDSEDLLLNRAATLRKLGQYEAAIADYDR
ncbi:MAG TPA: hypothetical protein DDW95_13520, partial [Alphaproteobacteria bacterium]|nr:hypothetical protein [Alphaproteobacteria bacterium]